MSIFADDLGDNCIENVHLGRYIPSAIRSETLL